MGPITWGLDKTPREKCTDSGSQERRESREPQYLDGFLVHPKRRPRFLWDGTMWRKSLLSNDGMGRPGNPRQKQVLARLG